MDSAIPQPKHHLLILSFNKYLSSDYTLLWGGKGGAEGGCSSEQDR